MLRFRDQSVVVSGQRQKRMRDTGSGRLGDMKEDESVLVVDDHRLSALFQAA